jgi:hypothetical protein
MNIFTQSTSAPGKPSQVEENVCHAFLKAKTTEHFSIKHGGDKHDSITKQIFSEARGKVVNLD